MDRTRTDKDITIEDLKYHQVPGGNMCFTGLRPKDLMGYAGNVYNGLVAWLVDEIYEKFYKEKGVRNFITGSSQGFNQLAFWAVEQMRRKYKLDDITTIVFAAEGQEKRWAKTGPFSIIEYNQMLRLCDVVVWVPGGTVRSLFERSHLMVDNSDYVLALYPDENWTSDKSGTSECIRYANNHMYKDGKGMVREIHRIPYTITDKVVPDAIIHCA